MTLEQKILSHTNEWAKKNKIGVGTELTPEQLKWKTIFETYPPSNRGFMIAAISEITGLNLKFLNPKPYSRVKFAYGVIIVPCGNENSHNYDLGKPILCIDTSSAYFVSANGKMGNHMDKSSSSIKLPTLEDITKFLAKLKKSDAFMYNKLQAHFEVNDEKTV